MEKTSEKHVLDRLEGESVQEYLHRIGLEADVAEAKRDLQLIEHKKWMQTHQRKLDKTRNEIRERIKFVSTDSRLNKLQKWCWIRDLKRELDNI